MGDFNNFNDSFNEQPPYLIEPVTLVDQVSSTEFYIGISNNGSDTSRPIWRIKKIWQDNTVWKFQFPNGDQSFLYIWDDRLTQYTYK